MGAGDDRGRLVLADFISEIVLAEVRRRVRYSRRAENLLHWVREAARPPPGVELQSADGSSFTGLILVDRNRPVVMFAARFASTPRPSPPSPPAYGGYSSSQGRPPAPMQSRLFDEEEEEMARRGETPPWFRR